MPNVTMYSEGGQRHVTLDVGDVMLLVAGLAVLASHKRAEGNDERALDCATLAADLVDILCLG